ncbi:MAG: outer membrane beta-barrel protein [Verrucomicrobia bacterium]|nr:outer membrane beta-barrel protein [Verrucomicrobiota bacterium]
MGPCFGGRLLCLVLGLILFQLLGATQGLAQESIRASLAGDAAAFANRPSLSNAGYNLQLGPVLARFSASLGLEFNDNITLSENNRESDLIVRPSVEANLAWQVSELNALRLDLGIGYAAYASQSQFDTQSLLIAPLSALSFDVFVGDFRITFFDQFSLLQNPVDEINLANVGRFTRFENAAGITVVWDLNKVILTGGYAHYNFESLTSNYSYLDRNEEQFFISGSLRATNTLSVGVRATGGLVNYNHNFNNNSAWYSFGPFLETQLTPYIHVSLEGGYQGGSFSTGGLNNDTSSLDSVYGRLQITHRVNRYITETFDIGREAMLGYTTNTTELTYIRYGAFWRINARATLAFDAFYEHGLDSPSDFESERVDRYGVGANIDYRLGRHLSTSLGYWFIDRTSDLPDRSYYQNRALWGITYEF